MAQEFYDFEDRKYMEPTVSRDEQLGFIDRLREIENKDLQKIATDTHNLGSDLPSNLGGLSAIGKPNSIGVSGADTGSAGIWRNRFERPQTNALVSGLKASAQAAALNTALNNVYNQYKHRYNEAYRNAQKAANNSANDKDSGYDVVYGDDYQKVLDAGAAPENWTSGQFDVIGPDGKIYSTIDVRVDDQGRIGGVDTPTLSYGGYDDYDGSRNPAKEYLDNLISQGYTFLTPDGKVVEIGTGE